MPAWISGPVIALLAFASLSSPNRPTAFELAQSLGVCRDATSILANYFLARSPRHEACAGFDGGIDLFTDHEIGFMPRSFAAPHQLHHAQCDDLVRFKRQHHQRFEHLLQPSLKSRSPSNDFPNRRTCTDANLNGHIVQDKQDLVTFFLDDSKATPDFLKTILSRVDDTIE